MELRGTSALLTGASRGLGLALAIELGRAGAKVALNARNEQELQQAVNAVREAALDHLGRIWAEELRESGVRVFSVDPGEMDTRMHADAIPDADRTSLARPEQVARRIVAMIQASERLQSGARLDASKWV